MLLLKCLIYECQGLDLAPWARAPWIFYELGLSRAMHVRLDLSHSISPLSISAC